MFIKLTDLLHHSKEVVVDPFVIGLGLREAGGEVLEPEHEQAQGVDEGGGSQRGVAVERHAAVVGLVGERVVDE